MITTLKHFQQKSLIYDTTPEGNPEFLGKPGGKSESLGVHIHPATAGVKIPAAAQSLGSCCRDVHQAMQLQARRGQWGVSRGEEEEGVRAEGGIRSTSIRGSDKEPEEESVRFEGGIITASL